MRKTTTSAVKQQRTNKNRVDFYPTPPSATNMFLSWLSDYHHDLSAMSCWEPAGGAGDMAVELKKRFDKVHISDWYDPANMGWPRIDFADQLLAVPEKYDWIITNPPFSLGLEFVQNGLKYSRWGYAMIMRIAFLEGVKRYENLFKDTPPTDVLIHVKRVSMSEGVVDEKRPSSVAYAWFVWDKSDPQYGKTTKVSWLI